MDLSKLPKLSNSAAPPSENAPPAVEGSASATPVPVKPSGPRPVSVGDVWISLGIGAILLFIAPRFAQWVMSRAGIGQFTWTFSDPQGNLLPYSKTVFFLGDMSVFAFAIVLIIDGIVSALRKPKPLLMFAIVLTAITILMNAYYVLSMFSGYGPQLFSLLAVVFGMYILFTQIASLKEK